MAKSSNIFRQIQRPKIQKSWFDLSHDHKTTFEMGELVPTLVMETLPGDEFNISVENLLRFAPLVSPVMHQIKVNTHIFFVPNRILWPQWEDFITGESEPDHPYIDLALGIADNALGKYFGLPKANVSDWNVNAFPIAAYLKIYDDYYRDEDLITEKFQELTNGANAYLVSITSGSLLRRAWQHDYATSALSSPQQGSEVTLPLLANDEAEVEFDHTKIGGRVPD